MARHVTARAGLDAALASRERQQTLRRLRTGGAKASMRVGERSCADVSLLFQHAHASLRGGRQPLPGRRLLALPLRPDGGADVPDPVGVLLAALAGRLQAG